MNIVFYHDDDNALDHSQLMNRPSSGTVMSLMNLATGLNDCNCKVTVLSKSSAGDVDGIDYIDYNSIELNNWYLTSNVDVFIAVGRSGKVLLQLPKIEGRKLIYWHHNYIPINSLINSLKKHHIDKVVCVSPNHLSSLYRYFTFRNTFYVRNILDINSFDGIKIEKERKGVAYVGNISKAKGFHKVILLFSEYVNQGGRESLNIYGSNSLYTNSESVFDNSEFDSQTNLKLDKLIKDRKVVFHGKVSRFKLYKNLARTKVVLCGLNTTGGAESAGMGMVEAQYLGCHVLTLRRGGQSDSVFDKNHVFSPNDTRKMVMKMLELDDQGLSTKFEACQKWITSRYNKRINTMKWLDMFEKNFKSHMFLEAVKSRVIK